MGEAVRARGCPESSSREARWGSAEAPQGLRGSNPTSQGCWHKRLRSGQLTFKEWSPEQGSPLASTVEGVCSPARPPHTRLSCQLTVNLPCGVGWGLAAHPASSSLTSKPSSAVGCTSWCVLHTSGQEPLRTLQTSPPVLSVVCPQLRWLVTNTGARVRWLHSCPGAPGSSSPGLWGPLMLVSKQRS